MSEPENAVAPADGAGMPLRARNEPEAVYTAAQGQTDGIGVSSTDAAELAALDADYQTHCGECFLGTLEWCEGGLAPNGQRCATTDVELLMYFRAVANRLLQQRNAADAACAALTARLAAVERERDSLREVLHMISKLPCTARPLGVCAACLAEAALEKLTDGG